MTQSFHELTEQNTPRPLGTGVLVEIEFRELDLTVELLGGNLRNLATAHVRAVSPFLSEEKRRTIEGRRVLTSEPNLRYFEEAEYQALGLEVPKPEVNGKGDLAFIAYERIIAVMKEQPTAGQDELPFIPLGSRVFFEFDYDDESLEEHQTEGGIIVQEKALAADNQMATVTGVGPGAQFVKPGDRVIVKRFASSIHHEGRRYWFVSDEHEIFAVLPS